MQGRGHVDAGEVVVNALEADVLGTGVGAYVAQEIGKAHAAPAAYGAPAFHADMARDLFVLRHGAQLGQGPGMAVGDHAGHLQADRKSTRLNSSHLVISYAVFCLKKKKKKTKRKRIP